MDLPLAETENYCRNTAQDLDENVSTLDRHCNIALTLHVHRLARMHLSSLPAYNVQLGAESMRFAKSFRRPVKMTSEMLKMMTS